MEKIKHNKYIRTEDIIRWAFENSRKATEEAFMLFATQGIGYYRRNDAINQHQKCSDLTKLGDGCTEIDRMTLKDLYGRERYLQTVAEIIKEQSQVVLKNSCIIDKDTYTTNIEKIFQRSESYVSKLKRFAHLLDEEQERELEAEKEDERQVHRPGPAEPEIPTLSLSKSVLSIKTKEDFLKQVKICGIKHVSNDLSNTSLNSEFEVRGWSEYLYCTDDFVRTVKMERKRKDDEYIRPIRYIVVIEGTIILISAFEANELITEFRQGKFNGKLHMYIPRNRPKQRVLFDLPSATLPNGTNDAIDDILKTQLSVFAGSLYFISNREQEDVCKFLGLCLAPGRSKAQQKAFDENIISSSGFVPPNARELFGKDWCFFTRDPTTVMIKHVQLRTRSEDLYVSHLGAILTKGLKLDVEEENKKSMTNPKKTKKVSERE